MIMYKENMSRYCLPLDDNSSASENACPGENLPTACFSSAAIERITIGETRSNMKEKRREKERKERKNRFFFLDFKNRKRGEE